MSTLQFPKNPSINDEYDWEGFKYVYDGQKWKTIGVGYNPVNDLKDKLEPRIDELEDDVTQLQSGNSSLVQAVSSLNVRVTAEEKDTKDWEGFTAELLAQGGVPDDGQPDEIGNSQRVDAIGFISGRTFKTVLEMKAATGLKVGQRVAWQGYYAQSDGGGNWGVVKSGAHADDGGSIFTIGPNTYIEANLKGKSLSCLKFGVKAGTVEDSSAALSACLNFASNSTSVAKVMLPADYITISSGVNLNLFNDRSKAIEISGYGYKSQIRSNVIGATTLNLIDATMVTLSKFAMIANNANCGHAVAFRDSEFDTGAWNPNSCVMESLYIRGFLGTDIDDSGKIVGAAGIYISDGVVNEVNRCFIAENVHGIYSDYTQQLKISNTALFNNFHSNLFAVKPTDTMVITNLNSNMGDGFPVSTTPVVVSGLSISAAAIILIDSIAQININDSKVKGDVTHMRAIGCRKVNVTGGWYRVSRTGDVGFEVKSRGTGGASLPYESKSFTISKALITSSIPDVGKTIKIVSAISSDSSRRTKVLFDDVRFHIVGSWEYVLNVKNNSGTDKLMWGFKDCFFLTNEGEYKSSVASVINSDGGIVVGMFSNNYINVPDGGGGLNEITNILTHNSAYPIQVKASGNEYHTAGGGVITNRLYGDYYSATVNAYTVSAGNLRVPIQLNEAPTYYNAVATTNANAAGLVIVPTSPSNQTKDLLQFRVFDQSGATVSGASIQVVVNAIV